VTVDREDIENTVDAVFFVLFAVGFFWFIGGHC
jgi:hypothetical protein